MLTGGCSFTLYLCSDEARMITGAAITIDGGIQGVDHPKVYDKSVSDPAFRRCCLWRRLKFSFFFNFFFAAAKLLQL